MAWDRNDLIPQTEITEKVTNVTVDFAKRFGTHLGTSDIGNTGKPINNQMTTSQLRKFFGEVKRQQMKGYDETDFILLKPKLAYAVGRANGKNPKIKDFYDVISKAIDCVKASSQEESKKRFKNFIKVFEAIVAYHKATEEGKLNDNN
ncbi:MAG: type III-A CRISPR-associated protein Csm2 [Paludibacteraceae bacterium]|nr:type III-A CRISPR-associated protein Csm2 [Paludibacteraceae bacterium]